MTFKTFNHHLMTNTVGPVVLAASLLKYHSKELLLSNLTFISSDSGSQGNFLSYENGFAAYGASKSALNMSIRHMAHELKVSGRGELSVFALHPGEVATDMAEVEVPWEVNGVLSPEESVKGCLQTIEARKPEESGTFWTWKAEVGYTRFCTHVVS
jgi:NAD(P)-dependent dehydrogenase (short-subunit alcohol dehydrogenase family)